MMPPEAVRYNLESQATKKPSIYFNRINFLEYVISFNTLYVCHIYYHYNYITYILLTL